MWKIILKILEAISVLFSNFDGVFLHYLENGLSQRMLSWMKALARGRGIFIELNFLFSQDGGVFFEFCT
jgi:hypothetical protein